MNNQVNTEKEFEIFFQEYYSPLLRYCFAIVKDRNAAEDIVQQAFISMWKALQAGRVNTGSRAYLYRSVYNGGLDLLKHQQVKAVHAQEILLTPPRYAESGATETRELQQTIERSLAKLPEQCRKIFMMSRFEHLTYKEIAAALSISEKTVENQVGKALKILRGLLYDYLPLLCILTYLFHD